MRTSGKARKCNHLAGEEQTPADEAPCIAPDAARAHSAAMMQRRSTNFRIVCGLCGLLIFLALPARLLAECPPAASAIFRSYVSEVESRLNRQHGAAGSYINRQALGPQDEDRLHHGEWIIEQLTPSADAAASGGMLHHWRGTAFAPGAKAADFDRLMRNFNAYPQHFAPQVLRAEVLTQRGERFQVRMRVRQRHVMTVVMDTTYDVDFERLDAGHGASASRSTQILEISDPGTATEHLLGPTEEHGFLWKLNTYWSYEQRDDGLYLQVESVSHTRSIPRGLGWAIRPFVQSVPRESLEFTLRSVCNALGQESTAR